MADPLSISASIIAVLQLTSTVVGYLNDVKDASEESLRIRDEITSASFLLYMLRDRAEQASLGEAWLSTVRSLSVPKGPLEQFKRALEQLAARLAPVNKLGKIGKALKWPFQREEIKDILSTIERQKSLFDLALQNDHVGLSEEIKDRMVELQIGQRNERRQKIQRWLSSLDPSSNHNDACKKRQPTTGAWFVGSDQFAEWKFSSNSFLWLHGIPGCGKTVLCSAVIQDVLQHCQSDSELAVAYFYFDFNHIEKQRHENLIRSLIAQLSMQSMNTPEALNTIYSRCQEGQQQPAADTLILTLQHMLVDFDQTFIILDALDECKEREELLELIEKIVDWKLKGLHILATSRREKDIKETLEPLITGQICIQSALVNADIQIFLRERLQNDPKLRKWPVKVQKEVETTLMDGAHGMFRWVVCQLDELRKCLKPNDLRRALKSLPKTLDDTYGRILHSINKEENSKDAFKILQWLAYSARPLRLNEMVDVIAVDIEDNPRFDPENRLPEPRDILTICSSLVTTAVSELRLAHFSVKEYLVSDRVPTEYSIANCAQENIARTCLTYLLYFKGPRLLTSDNINEFPLARYAAEHWMHHARMAGKNADRIYLLIMELFQSKRDAYINWVRLFEPDRPWLAPDLAKSLEEVPSPLYYPSLEGLIESVRQLVNKGAEVNAQGGYFGNALQAASYYGHDTVVQRLFKAGAEFIEYRGKHGN